MSTPHKQCTRCRERFPKTLEYFPPSNGPKSTKSGLHPWCKSCKRAADTIRWRRAHASFGKKDGRSHNLDVPGFVYLFRSDIFYKIGVSIDPSRRLKDLNVACPIPIEQVCSIGTDNMVSLEYALHQKFKQKHHHGEWFVLDSADIEYIKQLVV